MTNFFNTEDLSPIATARMNCAGTVTSIPNTVSGPGAFATKLLFNSISYDTTGTIADLVNSQMNIIPGYAWCRIGYGCAFDVNAVGWRGVRIKNGVGGNYGNQRLSAVAADATTNSTFYTAWIMIVPGFATAPYSIQVNDVVNLWPAQTSGAALNAGVDTATSFLAIEFRN